jgi:iron complex outermembrane receptor protein
MNNRLTRALCATTALAGGLLMATGAFAQSTGTAMLEEVVVTASGVRSQNGAIVAVEAPKSRATITQDFIATQAPSQTVLDTHQPAAGCELHQQRRLRLGRRRHHDPRLRLAAHLADLQDGVPLNDSGNYAIYPNQQMDPT